MPDTKKAKIILPSVLNKDRVFPAGRPKTARQARTNPGGRSYRDAAHRAAPRNLRMTQPNKQKGN